MAKWKKRYKPFTSNKNVFQDMWTGVGNGGANNQLPADFLIDEEGKIVDLFRAERVADSIPFERIEAFIPEDKRCKCNAKDCISSTCRKNYTEIRRESAIYTG